MKLSKLTQKRLLAQYEEAKFVGLEKTASLLKSALSDFETREGTTSHGEMIDEVQSHILKAAVQIADFYRFSIDVNELTVIVEDLVDELEETIRTMSNGTIGDDDNVPGEERDIEVSNDI